MESYTYSSSYPDSGDSSPRSREIECDPTAAAGATWADDQPPPRVKLMCSYGGRIQPRSHDNQLSYVGGDTKILAVDRSIRFAAIIQRLTALSNSSDDVLLKYQLPGEDLDALISVTNDEDLDHMMIEYDRLHRSPNSRPAPRLRLFLFNVTPISASNEPSKPDRTWFVDALNSVPPPPVVDAAPVVTQASPDFLFGLDKGFVPPPAVKVKDLASEIADPPARTEFTKPDLQIGVDPVVSPVEIQRLQISENQNNQQVPMQRNGSEETLARVYPGDYYVPRVPEKATAPPPTTAAYWPDPRPMAAAAAAGRYASVAGGDQQFFLIPAGPAGVYPPAGQGYYTAVQRVLPADVFRETAAAPAMYMAAPPPAAAATAATAAKGNLVEVTSGFGAPQVAYDSAGRTLYYTGAPAATYQAVASVAMNGEAAKVLKPSQVS